jgi:hypothetical protein
MPPPQETCVRLRLDFGGCSHDELDAWTLVVQEAVDTLAGDEAPDAAVRGMYEPFSVEILFTVENETKARVHQRIAAVVAAVESVVPSAFDTDTATRSPHPRELVPA